MKRMCLSLLCLQLAAGCVAPAPSVTVSQAVISTTFILDGNTYSATKTGDTLLLISLDAGDTAIFTGWDSQTPKITDRKGRESYWAATGTVTGSNTHFWVFAVTKGEQYQLHLPGGVLINLAPKNKTPLPENIEA